MSALSRLWYTVRHLKPEQIFYRLYNPFRKLLVKVNPVQGNEIFSAKDARVIELSRLPESDIADPAKNYFAWINKPYHFGGEIDWSFKEYGALWAYHLHSFIWLERTSCEDSTCTLEILKSRAFSKTTGTGVDPYPTSLRLQNCVRWVLRQSERPDWLLEFLFGDASRLAVSIEWHLLGNHLLENAFGLFHAGVFFNNSLFLDKSISILNAQLDEQFLEDGGHFERSIHYHCKAIAGIIKCLQLIDAFPSRVPPTLKSAWSETVAKGLGWLKNMQFSDGTYPAFGDSFPKPSPDIKQLMAVANDLGIATVQLRLSDSNYRFLRKGGFEIAINAGVPAPSYQPGHSHADVGTFCIHANGRPLIVDTGISTYERNELRQYERSTQAHNCTVHADRNSSDVWASFRIGKRATASIVVDNFEKIELRIVPFASPDAIQKRIFEVNDYSLNITDHISYRDASNMTFLHFHPDTIPLATSDSEIETGNIVLATHGVSNIRVENYEYCEGFNSTRTARRLIAEIGNQPATFSFNHSDT
jgi:hypothetical protein